jgi:hypothetical protein
MALGAPPLAGLAQADLWCVERISRRSGFAAPYAPS